jgi:hypothetical protein
MTKISLTDFWTEKLTKDDRCRLLIDSEFRSITSRAVSFISEYVSREYLRERG